MVSSSSTDVKSSSSPLESKRSPPPPVPAVIIKEVPKDLPKVKSSEDNKDKEEVLDQSFDEETEKIFPVGKKDFFVCASSSSLLSFFSKPVLALSPPFSLSSFSS
jgi:hypothetical protein